MEPDVFGGRFGPVPCGGRGLQQFAPQFVDQLDAQRDMAQHFPVEGLVLIETAFRVGVLPQLAAIVEQHAGEQQVAVQFRIDRGQGGRAAHHLGHMFHQTAAARVVVAPRGGGAPEAFAELVEKPLAQGRHPGIGDGGAEPPDVREIAVLFVADHRIAGEKRVEFPSIRFLHADVAGFGAEGPERPGGFQPADAAVGEFLGLGIGRGVRPYFERKMPGTVGQAQFEVGFVGFGEAVVAALQLCQHRRGHGGVTGLLFEGGDRNGTHAPSMGGTVGFSSRFGNRRWSRRGRRVTLTAL